MTILGVKQRGVMLFFPQCVYQRFYDRKVEEPFLFMLGMTFLSIWWGYSGTVLVNTDLWKHLSDNWDIPRCSTTPGSHQHLSSVTTSSSEITVCFVTQVSFSEQRSLLQRFVLHTFKLIQFSSTGFLKYVLQEVGNYQCRLIAKLPRAKQNPVSKS